MPRPFTFAIIGADHVHIFGMLAGMLETGSVCKGWWSEGEPEVLDTLDSSFSGIPRVDDRRRLLEDPEIELVLIAARPDRRAALAIEALRHGKAVMSDKPGATKPEDIAALRAAVADAAKPWSVNFSERTQVRASVKALDMVQAGAIGQVLQTIGLGPHKLNKHLRPDWFWSKAAQGGLLVDLGAHQIDQFMAFTGSASARLVSSTLANLNNPEYEDFDDFGEISLFSEHASGYARIDWLTPNAVPNWGDNRLFILGTEGSMEVRKYVDPAGRDGRDHLIMTTGQGTQYIDCSTQPIRYFSDLVADITNGTETAMTQEHAFVVTELAIAAQRMAARA